MKFCPDFATNYIKKRHAPLFYEKNAKFEVFAIEYWISDVLLFFSSNFAIFSANFLWNFVRISRQIPEKSDVCRFFNQICENKLENCRKFWNLWKLFIIIHYYSFVSRGDERSDVRVAQHVLFLHSKGTARRQTGPVHPGQAFWVNNVPFPSMNWND